MIKRDQFYMNHALKEAKKAEKQGEVPVGAVVIDSEGTIIGTGYNLVETYHSQKYHAEMMALEEASQYKKDWRLEGCTLYVTLEPCVMCYGLAMLSRVHRVVYGTESPLFGGHLDKESVLTLYSNQIKNITSNVCADESLMLLQHFFTEKRN